MFKNHQRKVHLLYAKNLPAKLPGYGLVGLGLELGLRPEG